MADTFDEPPCAESAGPQAPRGDQAWLDLIYQSAPDPLFLISVEPDECYRFVSVNEAFLTVTGLAPERVLNQRVEEVIPAPAHALVLAKYREAVSANRTIIWEEVSVYPTGKRVGEVKVTPLRDEATGRRYLVGAVRDITALREQEAAARRSEELLRTLLQSFPKGSINVFDRDLRYLIAEGRGLSEVNLTSHELVGRTQYELFPADLVDLAATHYRRVFEGETVSFELPFQNQVYNITSAPLYSEGREIYAALAVAVNITERRKAEEALRESEERYRRIISNAPLAVFMIDRAGRFTLSEGKGLEAAGLRAGEIVGQSAFDVYGSLEVHAHTGQVMTGGEALHRVFAGEIVRGVTQAGEVYYDNSFLPIRNADGEVVGMMGVAFDISESKQLEEQLRQAQKLESVGLLAGGIAHDFNNMLTAINGYSELILRQVQHDDSLRHKVEEIRKAGARAATLTYQLLAFSRKQILQPRLININEIVADVAKMLQRLIGEDIDLLTVLGERLGQVETDPGQITQVLMNLAVNARDAMPLGGKLTLETANVEVDEVYASQHLTMKPGAYVMLAVSDTGVGIDAQTQKRIFEPFFTTKGVGKGTGMGLATVYGIVKQSGGHIWVYSEVGRGTTFKIYLPRVERNTAGGKADALETGLPTGTERILLVEDEDLVRHLTKQILEMCGYTVLEAANGVEAVKLCEEEDCDIHLLITDVVMPHLGGRELVSRLAESRPALRVLYMSGYTSNAIVHHGVLDEDTNFIQKPFAPEALARKVREVLDAP